MTVFSLFKGNEAKEFLLQCIYAKAAFTERGLFSAVPRCPEEEDNESSRWEQHQTQAEE